MHTHRIVAFLVQDIVKQSIVFTVTDRPYKLGCHGSFMYVCNVCAYDSTSIWV
jgi:hypothetical protein